MARRRLLLGPRRPQAGQRAGGGRAGRRRGLHRDVPSPDRRRAPTSAGAGGGLGGRPLRTVPRRARRHLHRRRHRGRAGAAGLGRGPGRAAWRCGRCTDWPSRSTPGSRARRRPKGSRARSPGCPCRCSCAIPTRGRSPPPSLSPTPSPSPRDADGRRVAVQQVPSGEVTYSPTRGLLQVTVPPLGYRRYWLHVADPGPVARGRRPTRRAPTRTRSSRNGRLRLRGRTGTTGALASAVDARAGTCAAGHRAAGAAASARSWSPTTATPGRTASPATTGPRRRGRLLSRRRGRARPGAGHRAQRVVVRRRDGRWSPRRSPSSPGRAAAPRSPSTSTGTRRTVCSSSSSRWRWTSPSAPPAPPTGRSGDRARATRSRWSTGSTSPARPTGWGLACTDGGRGRLRRPGRHAAAHRAAQPAGGGPRAGLGRRRPRRLPGHRPGAPPRPLRASSPTPAPPPAPSCPGVPPSTGRASRWCSTPGTAAGSGRRPRRCSLEADGVLVPVLKRAEDGGGTVARLWEVAGSHRRVRLSLGPAADGSPAPGRASCGPTRCAPSSCPTGTRPGHGPWTSPSSTCGLGPRGRLRGPPGAPPGARRRAAPRWRRRSRSWPEPSRREGPSTSGATEAARPTRSTSSASS